MPQMPFYFAVALLLASDATATVRFDLSGATGRRDAETRGWPEWEISSVDSVSQPTGAATITLRGVGEKLEGFLHKPGLVSGATIASDGIRCEGSAIEIEITDLPPGRHSLATFHNIQLGEPIELSIVGKDVATSVTPSVAVASDHKMAAAYLEFDVSDDNPVKILISPASTASASTKSSPIVLNALELDNTNPRMRAVAPTPADEDGHVDGDDGTVRLSWTSLTPAQKYDVYFASATDAATAMQIVSEASRESESVLATVGENHYAAPVRSKDSLRFYCWRVDTIDDAGKATKGDVWTFRIRSLAFPGAEGYGRFARGGRGGKVFKVTNLNDSGPGSLRAAVDADGARTVVFDVSGRIVLQSRLAIRNNQLTIAGQTAPGKGVCISNYNLGGLGAEDLILRYLRVRPGDTSGMTLDGMGLASCDNAIVDHCSISWTQDESFSSRGAKNITLQRTLISEALNIAGHKKYGAGKSHGFAASIGGDIGSFHHNLLAHCAGRNWSLAGGIDQANRHRGRLDIRNNVVYNWDHRTTDGGAQEVQFVNNYYKPGPASRIMTYLNPQFENPSFGPQQYFVQGNVIEGVVGPEGPTGILEGVKVRGRQEAPAIVLEPFFKSDVETQPAEQAYTDVLNDVGCNVPELDEHDRRVIRETRAGTTTYSGSKSGKPGLPDSQQDVGGWEDYPEVHRPAGWDSDGDGMPTAWEKQQGLDPADPSDGAIDPDGDGYTNLEDYLNSLVKSAG